MFNLTRTLQLVKGALFDPEATWRGYLGEAGDWKRTALLLTGPLIVAAAIIAYLLGFLGGGLFGFRPTLVSMLLTIVSGAVAIAVVTFIFSGLAAAFGGKNNFALGLAATTLAFVPGYVGQALSIVPWIGWLLSFGLVIYALVLLWRIIPIYLEVPTGRRAGHYVVSLIASIVAMFVISAVLGRGMLGRGMHPGFGTMTGRMGANSSVSSENSSAPTGLLGGIARQGELMSAAQEDRYDPPRNGEVSRAQVEELIRVMQRTREAVGERQTRLEEMAKRADQGERPSLGDLGAVMSGVTEAAGLSTAEIEVVKSAGGNWAEHQWVKDSLRTAWLQKDINDTVARNYALYQQYEDQLAEFIAQ
jgi:Yip1 domain